MTPREMVEKEILVLRRVEVPVDADAALKEAGK